MPGTISEKLLKIYTYSEWSTVCVFQQELHLLFNQWNKFTPLIGTPWLSLNDRLYKIGARTEIDKCLGRRPLFHLNFINSHQITQRMKKYSARFQKSVTDFMQRECRWQCDVGTRTRQAGKASSRVWLVRSRDRDKSWRAWGESSPHLETHGRRSVRRTGSRTVKNQQRETDMVPKNPKWQTKGMQLSRSPCRGCN